MPYFNRFDIVQAWYWALADCHNGAGFGFGSYGQFCRVSRYYTPGASESGPENENSQAIYDAACARLLAA